MSDLARKFFESELNSAEDLALDAELEHSPEAAEAFAEAALAHYALLGLPEAEWNRRGVHHAKKAIWPLALFFGVGFLYSILPTWKREPVYEESRLELRKTELKRGRQEAPESPLAGRAEEIRRQQAVPEKERPVAPGAAGVVIKQRRTGDAEVWVEDAQGRRVATLLDGELRPGEHRFSWDGHLDGGANAPLGTYQMVVKRGDSVLRKKFKLK